MKVHSATTRRRVAVTLLLGMLVAATGVSSTPATPVAAGSGSTSPDRVVRLSPRRIQAAEAAGAITFSEFSVGTSITDQYQDRGILLSGDAPYIATDGCNPTSPVLSGTPRFEGAIEGIFVVPGTKTPITVTGFSLDVGCINDPGAVEITYYDADGSTIGSVPATEDGINTISVSDPGIQGFVVHAVSYELAGFAIDNVLFEPTGSPAPTPTPTPDPTVAPAPEAPVAPAPEAPVAPPPDGSAAGELEVPAGRGQCQHPHRLRVHGGMHLQAWRRREVHQVGRSTLRRGLHPDRRQVHGATGWRGDHHRAISRCLGHTRHLDPIHGHGQASDVGAPVQCLANRDVVEVFRGSPLRQAEVRGLRGGDDAPADRVRYAIDLVPPKRSKCAVSDAPARAVAAGKVAKGKGEGSITVQVDHGGGFGTGYYHLTNILVKKGDAVTKGQALGYPACVGTDGTHLHFYVCYQPLSGFCEADAKDETSARITGTVLGGWRVGELDGNYNGTLKKDGEKPLEANEAGPLIPVR